MKQQQTHFTAHDLPPHHVLSQSRSKWWIWILLISLVFVISLVLMKWEKISTFFAPNQVSTGLTLWAQVSLEGIITADGDFITHTHTLTTLNDGIFGLKSKTINLNLYTGLITLEGIVDNEREGLYILEVSQVFQQGMTWTTTTGVIQTWTVETGISAGAYLPSIGIYLPSSFFDDYSIQNSGQNWKLLLTHLSTQQKITLSAFVCKKWDPNTDCDQLTSTFSDNNEKSFTASNGEVFYKLPEVTSWFGSTPGLFGYFINDVSESEVVSLLNAFVLVSSDYVKNGLTPRLADLCKEGTASLSPTGAGTLYISKGNILFKIAGTVTSGTAECVLHIDPSLSTFATLDKFTIKQSVTTTGSVTVSSGQLVNPAPSVPSSLTVSTVKQFPITLDKTLTFTSSRGFSIIFPSKKITFQSSTISSNLDTKGVNCYMQMNVVDYANKAVVADTPTVKIYECSMKSDVVLSDWYRVLPFDEKKSFVVEAVDPAWVDFANNVQVTK